MHRPAILAGAVALASLVVAQFPANPVGITTLNSKLQSDVIITYKQTDICETTPGVKSYSGYLHLPSSLLGDIGANYNISTFFWYFEARNSPSTAPLAIYLSGGPGESSTYSALSSESGPCFVNADGNSTTVNQWSFNNHVNMLYIDQPVQTGFSYDKLVNATYDLLSNMVTPVDASELQSLHENSTFGVGTFASQNVFHLTNTSVTSAKALWHFAENWLTSFPEYNTTSNKISLWTNSYGGYWAPATVSLFHNELSQLPASSPLHKYKMDTLGITNGCIDELYLAPIYPQLAYNNTYGVEFIPEAVYKEASHNFTKPGGCKDLILQCRELGMLSDPQWLGNNQTVNEACVLATDYCAAYVIGAFDALNNRSAFDVAVLTPDPCPFYLPVQTYLNEARIQAALGVPVNFTYDDNLISVAYGFLPDPTSSSYFGTGDSFRKGIHDFEDVLSAGIKVAMVYGDRDYRCNWLGGEATANAAAWPHQAAFQHAGYERFVTNETHHGGVTKQYAGLSFTRVFNAGHSVNAYAPETVYHAFMRSMFGRDVATGTVPAAAAGSGSIYKSTGPLSSWEWKNVLPENLPRTCIVEGAFQNVSIPDTLME